MLLTFCAMNEQTFATHNDMFIKEPLSYISMAYQRPWEPLRNGTNMAMGYFNDFDLGLVLSQYSSVTARIFSSCDLKTQLYIVLESYHYIPFFK